MLIWVHGYGSPTDLHKSIRNDPNYPAIRDTILQYLERIIKQQLPERNNLVTTSEPHQCLNDSVSLSTCNTSAASSSSCYQESTLDNALKDCEGNTQEKSLYDLQTLPTLSSSQKYHVLMCRPPVPDSKFRENMDLHTHLLVKSCNIHSHSFTCYKYGNHQKCRFDFERPVVQESYYKDEEIVLKRLHPMVNNYEETILCCTRSNMDIKFIGSGKDSRSLAFYITNYQTKNSLSTTNVLPLISGIVRNVNECSASQNQDSSERARQVILKCLNRITTQAEMSCVHVCSLLLGHEDKVTSHAFRSINMFSILVGDPSIL